MSRRLEIFRPIVGGSKEMASFAVEVALSLGATGDFKTLRWSERPKLLLLTLGLANGGDIGDIELVHKVMKMGINGEEINPSLILWGWDLPSSTKVESGRRQPRPEIRLIENRSPESSEAAKTGDEILWKELNRYANNAANNVIVDSPASAALRNNLVKKTGLVAFDPSGKVATEEEFRDARRDYLAEMTPKLTLGPVDMRITSRTFRGISDYGSYRTPE